MVIKSDKAVERLKQRVRALVRVRAEASVPHYYLSRMGNELQDEGFDVRRLTGDSLERLLLGMGYELGSASTLETGRYIYTTHDRSKPDKPFRFSKKLWLAFETPGAESQQRFINLRTFAFGQIDEVRHASDEIREIAWRYISKGPTDRDADVIRERIHRWLEEQALSRDSFADDRSPRTT